MILMGCACWGVKRRGASQGAVSRVGGIPACNEAHPPPVNRMTDRCNRHNLHNFVTDGKNIFRVSFAGSCASLPAQKKRLWSVMIKSHLHITTTKATSDASFSLGLCRRWC